MRFEEACRAAQLSAQAAPFHCADVKRRCDSSDCEERVDRRSVLLTADYASSLKLQSQLSGVVHGFVFPFGGALGPFLGVVTVITARVSFD